MTARRLIRMLLGRRNGGMTVAKRTRERARQAVKPSPLTVEVALYFIIAVMAVGLRLYKLGDRPMQAGEAAQALAAWRLAQGLPQEATLGQHSPLLFTSNLLLFALFGASDFLARLVPALSGALLVIGPYFLRQRLGRLGALAASFVLALSPSALFFSRYLGGEIVVAACALVIAWGLFEYLDQRQPKHLYVVAVALALALSAGAGTYTFVFVVATFGLVLALADRFSGPSEYWQRILDTWRAARGTNGLLRDCAALFVLVLVLVCTGFLLRLSGLQDGIDLFSGWLAAFRPRMGGHPWHYHLQLLLLYEPLILVFGLAAVVYLLLRQRDPLSLSLFAIRHSPFAIFLAYWTLAAFLVYALASGRGPGDVLLMVLPLALLAGAFIGRLLDELVGRVSWVREGLFVAVACAIVVYLGLQLGAHVAFGRHGHLFLALAAGFVLIGLLVLCWISFGREPTLRAGWLVLLLSVTTLTVGSSCYLNYRRGSDPREIMLASPTSRNLFDLLETLERVSSRETGDPRTVAMTVHQGAGPALAWHLRDFDNVKFVAQLSPSVDTPVVIAPAEEQEPTLGADYSGQDFVLSSSWKPQGLSGSNLMRWLFYRQAQTSVQTDNVILWVKQELLPEGSE
ncbi:MAG: TIGR03663 family protein [Chloroflexi bacterium]|nr:TIGR03663 family protein [Chloroflexota bacterium]